MNEPWFEEWVKKAEEDYLAASTLDPGSTPGAICFHCQQCVEKYLKACLVKHGLRTRKVHNLVVLNSLVAEQDERFERLYDYLTILNPYSVIPRYPGFETTPDDAERAVKIASTLRNRIRDLLEL